MKRGPVIYVEWVDSRHCTQSWERINQLNPLRPVVCTTVGLLVDEDKTTLRLTNSIADYDDDDVTPQVSGVCEIPKCAITKRRTLKV